MKQPGVDSKQRRFIHVDRSHVDSATVQDGREDNDQKVEGSGPEDVTGITGLENALDLHKRRFSSRDLTRAKLMSYN